MKKNNILGDRLNAFKHGQSIPEINDEKEDYRTEETLNLEVPEKETKIQLLLKIGYELFNLSFVVLKSLAYGYAGKIILKTNWEFWGVMAVGFSVYSLTIGIKNIFTKNKNE